MLKSLVTLLLLTALGFSNADAQYIFVSSDFETEGTKTSTYTVLSSSDILVRFVHTPGIAAPPLSYPLIYASRIRVYINDILQFSSGGNLSVINYWGCTLNNVQPSSIVKVQLDFALTVPAYPGNPPATIVVTRVPLAPTGLTTSTQNDHPRLTWNANCEPDISYYEIWKKGGNEGGDWHLKTTSSNTYYVDASETVTSGPAHANEGYVYYKINAVNLSLLKSDFSSQVQFRVNLDPLSKFFSGSQNGNAPLEFGMLQNYPNPFNPSTKIIYSISEDAKIMLKVYDILGVEVAELVNETKPAGFYEATFNASNISSGIYIYRITAIKGESVLFNESKRMILMK